MLNNVVYISGTLGGKGFSFYSATELEMSVAGSNLVSAQEGDAILLQIKLAALFQKIDFTSFINGTAPSINEGAVIHTTGSPCPAIDPLITDLYSCLMRGLATEANLGKDSNGNGELDSSEWKVK